MRSFVDSLLTVTACASTPPRAPVSAPAPLAEIHFANPNVLVLAELDGTKEVGVTAALRYPRRQRQLRIEAEFATIFAIDTSGAGEPGSITFCAPCSGGFHAVAVHAPSSAAVRVRRTCRGGTSRVGREGFYLRAASGRWMTAL